MTASIRTRFNPMRDGSVGSVMPDFNFNNLKLHLVEFVVKTLDHRKKRLYRAPEVRQYWDDEQEEFESDWAELFFDLIYVAMGFKIGETIKEQISQDDFSFYYFFLFFVGQFLPMYEAWHRRTNYMARFVADSLFHKSIDILENILIGFMALFIGTGSDIRNTAEFTKVSRLLADEKSDEPPPINLLFCFTIIKIVFHLVYCLKYLEIRKYCKSQTEKRREGVRNMTTFALKQQLFALCLSLISSVCSYFGEYEATLITLILGYLIVSFVLPYIYYTPRKKFGVPFNVFFFIKRYGEYTMLMLGEGVLQIIILDIGDAVTSHLSTFALAYFIVNTLQFLKFYILPAEPQNHVFVKSKGSGAALVVLLLYPLFFMALICIGVALKLVLEENDTLNEDVPKNRRIMVLLCVSLTFSVFCLILKNVLHLGCFELLFKSHNQQQRLDKEKTVQECTKECGQPNNLRGVRISYSVMFVILSLSFLILILIPLSAVYLLSLSSFFLLVLFFVSVAEKKFFDDKYISNSSHGSDNSKALDFLTRPVFEQELWAMNSLWKRAFESPPELDDVEAKEAFELSVVSRKRQLKHMLTFMKAHSNYLQQKIGRTQVEKAKLEKVEKFLNEVRELRELTSLIEENLYFLFSQHASCLPNLHKSRKKASGPLTKLSMNLGNKQNISSKYSTYFSNIDEAQSTVSNDPSLSVVSEDEDRDSADGSDIALGADSEVEEDSGAAEHALQDINESTSESGSTGVKSS